MKTKVSKTTTTAKKPTNLNKPTVMAKARTRRISKSKALELMESSKGKFFTATFTKKDKTLRTLNGKFQGVSKLGYVRMQVMEKGKPAIKSVNLQTIESLTIDGVPCKVTA